MSVAPTILIMAGGTGGHIMPGLAVADVLKARGWNIQWLGNPDKMEGKLVPARGYPLVALRFAGVRGTGLLSKMKSPFLLLKAVCQAWRQIGRVRPNVVLGMGGYVAFPGGVVAALRSKPLVLHEQNAVAGMTNRWLGKIARRKLAGFPDALPGAEVVGNPVRQDVAILPDPSVRFAGRVGPLRLLVVGGSLGAQALNSILPKALALIESSKRPIVVHQAGVQHIDGLIESYKHVEVQAQCLPFIDDMAAELGQADLLICRAGAMTVAEVCAAGVAALFVPFPAAVDDHQTANAKFLSNDSAAWIQQQRDLTPEWLAHWIEARTRDELCAVATRARAHAQPESAQRIAAICEELAEVGA